MNYDEQTLNILRKLFPNKSVAELLEKMQEAKEERAEEACRRQHEELKYDQCSNDYWGLRK